MNTIRIDSLADLDAAASVFLNLVGDAGVIAFYGNMGAGKTTFITALCRQLGVSDDVCSPTFTIVNEYQAASGEPVYHFDFYRIKDLREAVDIGLDEYFYSGCLCLVEWPEMIEELLPEDVLRVRMEAVSETSRVITF